MLLEIKRNQAPLGSVVFAYGTLLGLQTSVFFFDKPITCHLQRLPRQARNATQKSQPICRGQLRACWSAAKGHSCMSRNPCFSCVIFSDWLSTYYWPVGSKPNSYHGEERKPPCHLLLAEFLASGCFRNYPISQSPSARIRCKTLRRNCTPLTTLTQWVRQTGSTCKVAWVA